MHSSPELKTRREFLRTGLLGGSLCWTLPAFLSRTMESLHAQADGSLVQGVTGKDGNILVVLQLAGGNDGLNTVIPVGNDNYIKARPKIAIRDKSALLLDPKIGLHPALTGLYGAFQEGHLAVVQAVGYPNPNRSHFRSTEIWATATDENQSSTTGWIGRYFDNACQGCDATVGIALAGQTPQAFAAAMPKGVLYQGGWSGAGKKRREEASLQLEADGSMMSEDDDGDGPSGGSIGEIAGSGNKGKMSSLDFLERTDMDAKVSQQEIAKAASRAKNLVQYPGSRLGQNFASVARLIAGGMPTRVYYISQGGYDTHVDQAGAHERLLREMGDAVASFLGDLKAQGNLGRVSLMTFSEFGRRLKENASGGTDHGAAAPLFLAGGAVHAGLHGKMPSLAKKDLNDGDVQFNVDFRSVYATVLEKHLGVKSTPILGRSFPILGAYG
ncbi:MAG: DUF1501 domain-containing protein [Verrucomicrobia bacterium]|nr:DUF1501 domain-containing protein [Verrucomicrobiota bacterium]